MISKLFNFHAKNISAQENHAIISESILEEKAWLVYAIVGVVTLIVIIVIVLIVVWLAKHKKLVI